jgi:hypothetical protein
MLAPVLLLVYLWSSGVTTLSIIRLFATFNITTLSIMTLSIIGFHHPLDGVPNP